MYLPKIFSGWRSRRNKSQPLNGRWCLQNAVGLFRKKRSGVWNYRNLICLSYNGSVNENKVVVSSFEFHIYFPNITLTILDLDLMISVEEHVFFWEIGCWPTTKGIVLVIFSLCIKSSRWPLDGRNDNRILESNHGMSVSALNNHCSCGHVWNFLPTSNMHIKKKHPRNWTCWTPQYLELRMKIHSFSYMIS